MNRTTVDILESYGDLTIFKREGFFTALVLLNDCGVMCCKTNTKYIRYEECLPHELNKALYDLMQETVLEIESHPF